MHDGENDTKPKQHHHTLGGAVEDHSLKALHLLVKELQQEIERIEQAIKIKEAGRDIAESFFKT